MIYILEDDPVLARCFSLICHPHPILLFDNIITALDQLDSHPPKLIILDILLIGPNGFTLLNELASYTDTANLPIIIVSSLPLTQYDLSQYHIVQIFDKTTLNPAALKQAVNQYYV